ncbi:MAG: RNA polymerase sigma factor [Actinomycetota bacterium]
MRVVLGDPPTDRELISRSLGDGEAFIGVFERHYDPVRRYLQRRVGQEAGEELAAETFLLAFSRRSSFDQRYSSAQPWIFGIATNVLRHHMRHERVSRIAHARLPREEEPQPDPGSDDRLLAASVSANLKESLASLREVDRDVLLLFALAELSYGEIGMALGIPVGTVRSRLNRARQAIKQHPAFLEAMQIIQELPFEPRSLDGRT